MTGDEMIAQWRLAMRQARERAGPEPLFISDAMFPDPPVKIETPGDVVVLGHPRYWARVVQACKAKDEGNVVHDPGHGFAYNGVALVELQTPAGRAAYARVREAIMAKATGPARTAIEQITSLGPVRSDELKPLDRSPTFL